jgi:putative Mn2+ efflux pump MntP
VEPRKKSNFKYACTCAVFASMATIVLGYGTYMFLSSQSVPHIPHFAAYAFLGWIGYLDHV